MADEPEDGTQPASEDAVETSAAQTSFVATGVPTVLQGGDFLAERKAGAPSTFRQVVFYGRVLRSGWGALLFCVVFVCAVVGESLLIEHFRVVAPVRHWYMSPRDLLNPLIALSSAVVATLLPSLFEQRHPNDYGFRGSGWKPLLAGFATSFAVATALCVGMRARGLLLPSAGLSSFLHNVKYGVIWAGILLMIALLEELLTRGYLQYTLARGLAFLYRRFLGLRSGVAAGFWTAAVLLSGFFMVLYLGNPGQTNAGLACVFVMGLLYSLSLWRTGDLWWAVGFHAAWDFTQGYVFGQWSGGEPIRDRIFWWVPQEPVALSGGKAGLNGSPLVYLALAAAFALLLLTMKKRVVYPELWTLAELQSRERDNLGTLPDPDRA